MYFLNYTKYFIIAIGEYSIQMCKISHTQYPHNFEFVIFRPTLWFLLESSCHNIFNWQSLFDLENNKFGTLQFTHFGIKIHFSNLKYFFLVF